ncbi:ArpA protein [Pseudomonas sp. SWRI59]|uniref:HalD/BesD family halogenase n=1 Tax=Pseudomonas TaxID=286 RepID=UPI0016489DD2|nr:MULTISPECIES: ArpA protein [unclassified Pseudomonas]MBC3481576.1 ArpA protein [Pseudomonas sp. SWRI77]MBC3502174.1 ArpA protein [Pseudomonas sp. SWRI59]MBC3506072.1 ArpA protein [Pseudomonas sp. SWRI68]MDD2128758.1 ArpA protein [Pseudomonas sp. 17391]UVL02315.1 ArpA protein [Pseudomonas sp. B21-047]
MSDQSDKFEHVKTSDLLKENPFAGRDFFWEQHRFERDGYLKINHLIDSEVNQEITSDVKYLLSNFAKRRDFLIESTGNTPRYLSNVPQETIEQEGRYIPRAYRSNYLAGLISGIVKEDVIPTPWKWDNYIINSQHKVGDTHGWHWGDYPYTIIWVVEAPDIECGGLLECVPHTRWDKSNPRVENLLLENKIDSYFHSSGDVYLLKADTTLHRVKPLTKNVRRIILNTTWERARDKDRHVEHETFVFRD